VDRADAPLVYSVKESFLTLQGEGFHAGRAAVFCRFAGCNLWSGREGDRSTAECSFCDTDFVGTDGTGGGKFADALRLADHLEALWGGGSRDRFIVFTGGEPLLQLDEPLLAAMRAREFMVAVETNGTLMPPAGIDWLTVSPKGTTAVRVLAGQELKLVFPQAAIHPKQFERLNFEHFFLQPLDGPNLGESTDRAVAYCLAHPRWRLSVQMHKMVGIV
jgi:7-carboxy-7-deazaguanine synthase